MFGLVALALVVGYRLFLGWVDDQMTPDAPAGDELEFTIVEGWSTNDVVASLGDAGVVDNPAMFRQWLRCPSAIRWLIDCPADVEYSFQAGEYVLQEHLGFEAVVALLDEGPLPEEVIRVTVPEGLTLEQMVDRLLSEMPLFDENELRAALVSDRLRWEYGTFEHRDRAVEGLLFPDTYQLDEATVGDELALILRMHQQFLRVVEQLLAGVERLWIAIASKQTRLRQPGQAGAIPLNRLIQRRRSGQRAHPNQQLRACLLNGA